LDARSWDHPSHPLEKESEITSLKQGAFVGEEAVLAAAGWAGVKSDLFEHPATLVTPVSFGKIQTMFYA